MVPPQGAGDYPMFTFCDGYSSDAEYSPLDFASPEFDYTNCASDVDDMESEAFEVI